jgi:diketogulonate reductase-like aldo/keto reductase
LQRRETTALCKQQGIVIEAYSPLTRGLRFGHPTLLRVASALNRSPAQVLLRWGLQHGYVVLPKSTRPERIAENAAVFDFELDGHALGELEGLEENLVTGWDPATQA